ncbi:MAG: hypothetical protein QNJ63_07040 [Calothrix sp. MO_192.B10]|nr:hypothetical protein [Calothrix sp. MO_192.B10]
MARKRSTFQKVLDIISKRLSQQRRNELLKEVAQSRQDYQQNNVKRGSVADLMAELDG